VNAFCGNLKWKRKRATALLTAITFVFGSFLAINERSFIFVVDLSSIYLAIVGALIASIALMWFYGSRKAKDELNMGSKIKFGRGWEIMSKYVYPVVLVVILLAAALLGIS
jgi:NSS family neurotransmitter:Na+ symporter